MGLFDLRRIIDSVFFEEDKIGLIEFVYFVFQLIAIKVSDVYIEIIVGFHIQIMHVPIETDIVQLSFIRKTYMIWA